MSKSLEQTILDGTYKHVVLDSNHVNRTERMVLKKRLALAGKPVKSEQRERQGDHFVFVWNF